MATGIRAVICRGAAFCMSAGQLAGEARRFRASFCDPPPRAGRDAAAGRADDWFANSILISACPIRFTVAAGIGVLAGMSIFCPHLALASGRAATSARGP
jgi:hypothetical protein